MYDIKSCFTFPNFLALIYTCVVFLAAYVLYRLIWGIVGKFLKQEGVGPKLLREIRYPALLLFLEFAALLSLQSFNFQEGFVRGLNHVVTVLFIGTIGWLAAGAVRSFYLTFLEKYDSTLSVDLSKRSLMTQMLFLYRLLMFIIIAVTVAGILLTFPYIRSLGLGILGSAGIAGIALGIAARPILLNFMAGFQIAVTKMIKIGDALFVENEFVRIESIHLTHVIVCTWDLRRIVLPISYFIDKPFQNWDLANPELLGTVFLYCDYTVPVDAVRNKVGELITSHPAWNRKTWNVQVTNCSEKSVEIRIVVSANDASAAFDLRVYLREKLIEFLQREYPESLPRIRNAQV